MPGPDAPEGGDANGERQAGRRRNRRGGRGGRDRDETGGQPTAAVGDSAGPIAEAAPAAATIDGEAAAPDAARGEGAETGESRRRGRGRDRNRRERSPEGLADNGAATATDGVTGETPANPMSWERTETSFATAAAHAPEPVPAEAVAAVAMHEPMAESFLPVEPAAMPIAAPVVSAPVPVAAVVTPPAAALAAPFVLPLDSLQAVAESAGLQWVNSDTDKIRAVQTAMASEPAPVHVPRERKAVVAANEGPLVLVETRRDLSQVKLPFETAQGASQPPV
jgi:ribonuclease E